MPWIGSEKEVKAVDLGNMNDSRMVGVYSRVVLR